MSLSLSRSHIGSSSQQLVELTISCSHSSSLRPAFSMTPTYTASKSTVSTVNTFSSCQQKVAYRRPTLKHEEFLLHAFGVATPPPLKPPPKANASKPILPFQIELQNRLPSAIGGVALLSNTSYECQTDRKVRDVLPTTPPLGTFRTIKRVSKIKNDQSIVSYLSSSPITPTSALESLCNQPNFRIFGGSNEKGSIGEHEKPMTKEQWRKKAEERLDRRRRRRTECRQDPYAAKLPLLIDIRPLGGRLGMGFPPNVELPRLPKKRSSSLSSTPSDIGCSLSSLLSAEEKARLITLHQFKSAVDDDELVKHCQSFILNKSKA